MAYPDENTPEFWDLVASGYRQLLDNPPRFVIPGIDRETQYAAKIKEAEDRAEALRFAATPPPPNLLPMPESVKAELEAKGVKSYGFMAPTKEVVESLERREAEMSVQDYSYHPMPEPKRVRVTEDVWREVFKLD